MQAFIAEFGRTAVRDAVRVVLATARSGVPRPKAAAGEHAWVETGCREILEARAQKSMRPVFNLTGTVLHTNLGRAPLPDAARASIDAVAAGACNLEFDLDAGVRGDRDLHIERLLCDLTGAEAGMVVNNNAAAVFLLLNTLALRKEVVVSRGELIEIGGSFRLPEIMSGAGCKLREVGTTNRTHSVDYEEAIGPNTRLIMKVHASNFFIQGYTSEVDERTLTALARAHGLPFVVDLGSGSLVNLTQWGLPAVVTPRQALEQGANLVTFSGDKLLGGPQAGMIVGDSALIQRLKRNPLKRALRVDKLRMAALEAVLKLYDNTEDLPRTLPALRLLTRPLVEIERTAAAILPAMQELLGASAMVSAQASMSQIGSGSLPVELLSSVCIAIVPANAHKGAELKRLARAFRHLPIPVIGRIEHDALCLDMRCLEESEAFLQQLPLLVLQ